MATVYVRDLPANQNTHKFTEYDRWRADRCMECGEPSPCHCRYCDSCSDYWMAATTADGDEGRRPRETCPDCTAPTEGEALAEALRLLAHYVARLPPQKPDSLDGRVQAFLSRPDIAARVPAPEPEIDHPF